MASTLLSIAFAICVASFVWFALAMEVHWHQVFGDRPRGWATPRRLRVGATAMLATALAACSLADHATMVPLVWIMLIAVGSALTAMLLAMKPHWLRWLIFRRA
jgi:hypothetical protein